MANIKDLKKRIRSTKGTYKITSAMKLVSAAKLAKAQGKITGLKPYSKELEKTVKTVAALSKDYSHSYFQESDNQKNVLLVISSDKGLCGAYNSGLAKAVKKFVSDHGTDNFKVFYIGKKVKELTEREMNVGKHYSFEKVEPNFDEMRDIAHELSRMFTMGEVGKVYVAYNTFISAIASEPVINKLLPLRLDDQEQASLTEEYPYDFKYEPAPAQILENLIPEVFVNSLYTCVLDAIAAEHGSRMSAMENASKNSKEMIDTLTLKMNKLRQAAITTELIEVVSGAESLNG